MKLYGGLASPYVARVVLFARLKDLTLVPEMPAGGIESPEHRAKSPMGRMPVLDVDGLAIAESDVIGEHLEDLHPAFGLPDPTAGDGSLGRWWSTMEGDPVTQPFLAECSAVLDAFLKSLARK